MASIEERFRAAVNVIKGLPKNGPYQPSTAMMLTFYGLYKQAKEGPCPQKKPAFWDIIGKAKWDAWNGNRYMTKEQAMQKYVDNLREIIETMSFTENVQDFVGSVSSLDNIDLNELEMIAPGMRELAESHPNSPFNSRTNSPQHGASSNNAIAEKNAPLTNGHAVHMNGDAGGSDDTDDDSTLPDTTTRKTTVQSEDQPALLSHVPSSSTYMSNDSVVDQSDDEYGDPLDIHQDLGEGIVRNMELLNQIQMTIQRMNADIAAVNQRMCGMERYVLEVHSLLQKSKRSGGGGTVAARNYPKWWPLRNISPLWFVLLILWPFVAQRVTGILLSSRRK